MFAKLERYFFQKENRKEGIDILRCFEVSKTCVREREPLCSLLLACASILVPSKRKRLESLCMDLAEQLLSPSKVLDLIRLRTAASNTTSKKKKIATTSSSTFLGGLNGKQVLERCSEESIQITNRASLVLPLHTAAAVAMFTTFQDNTSHRVDKAIALLEQQIVLETLLKTNIYDMKTRKTSSRKKRKVSEQAAKIQTSEFVNIPYGVALWIIERAVSGEGSACSLTLPTRALKTAGLNIRILDSTWCSIIYLLIRIKFRRSTLISEHSLRTLARNKNTREYEY
jgi:hypothetical protein